MSARKNKLLALVVMVLVASPAQPGWAQWDKCGCDLTPAAGAARFRSLKRMSSLLSLAQEPSIEEEEFLCKFLDQNMELPDEFDWRDQQPSRLGPVRAQFAQNCWAYATAALLEAHQEHLGIELVDGRPVKLSEQYLTECTDGRTNPCNGSFVKPTLTWLAANGAALEQDYPTDESCDQQCRLSAGAERILAGKLKGGISRVMDGCHGFTERALRTLLVSYGPVAMNVDMKIDKENNQTLPLIKSLEELQLHDPIDLTGEPESNLGSHVVLLVGYGADSLGNKYWTIQNSWGTEWASNGYGFLHREVDYEKFPNYRPFTEMTIPYY